MFESDKLLPSHPVPVDKLATSERRESGLSCNKVSYTWNLATPRLTNVLQEVSFTVGKGEIVSIVGPTGCGKSTLLRLAMGLMQPTSGGFTLDGDPIREPTRKMGIIFQEHGLFPWMTVAQNVEFGLRIRHMSVSDRKVQSEAILAAVGLPGQGSRYPHELSGGMKRRVAIARLLANDAEYLLMDEPFEALDYQTRFRMQQFLLSIRETFSRSILLVTHQVDEAILLSDRILLMTACPGSIKGEVSVDLARPRDLRAGKFNDYRTLILDHLEGEIARAFQPEN